MTLITATEFQEYTRNELDFDHDQINAVLRATDDLMADLCQRRWDLAGETATERVYSPRSWSDVIRIHDCTTVTAVTAKDVTVAASEYQLEPLNGLDWAGNARPYEQIRRIGNHWPFDNFRSTVAVTATWGWPSIPPQIKQAAYVLAKDISMHRDVSFGTIIVPDVAALRVRQASLITDLVKSFRRPEALGGIGGPT